MLIEGSKILITDYLVNKNQWLIGLNVVVAVIHFEIPRA